MLHKMLYKIVTKYKTYFKYIFNHKTKPNRIAHFEFVNKREQNLENCNSVKSGNDL